MSLFERYPNWIDALDSGGWDLFFAADTRRSFFLQNLLHQPKLTVGEIIRDMEACVVDKSTTGTTPADISSDSVQDFSKLTGDILNPFAPTSTRLAFGSTVVEHARMVYRVAGGKDAAKAKITGQAPLTTRCGEDGPGCPFLLADRILHFFATHQKRQDQVIKTML